MRAHGADAATFLQGQLTQDVSGLPMGQLRLAGYCSPKGRLLASLIVWRLAGDEFGLLCSTDAAAAVAKRLSMYVLRARCKIESAAADWVVYGVAGVAADAPPGRAEARDKAWWLGLPAVDGIARALLVQPRTAAAPALPLLDLQYWRWLEVSSGVPRITAATADRFVPQMINFELVGGVNFQKGCYPGQEVVARSQYRGTLKRRMHLFATEGEAAAAQELFHSADPAQPAGMVVNAASEPGGGSLLLAEVKIAALESGTLHLGGAQGPLLRRLALPYPVADTADV